ncbi:cytochrome P450 [Frankia sp. CiP3]|uniref:cytochrome P450 n=1 Tax=Frankia sp. CiP3 TaxID=2880971 RepID=UPI001EF4B1DD|nr:cytochrome P450 [Frankia sp. CiP3]
MSDESGTLNYPFAEPAGLAVHPNYAQLRGRTGLARVRLPYGKPAWLATRYDDVKGMLSDPRFSREQAVGEDEPRVMPYVHRPDTLTTMDPPRHSRLRRVVAKAFSSRHIETLRPKTELIVSRLLDAMEEHGPPVDLMHSFALSTSMLVVCELLGVPFEDRKRFHEWSEVLASTASANVGAADLAQANGNLRAYLADLIGDRRREHESAQDLLSVIVAARDTEDRLSEDEMISLAWSVLLAGYEITAYEIGDFAYTLLTRPHLVHRLRDQPDLVVPAVEELLRQVPLTSAAFYARVATEDLELGGTLVRAGEAVLASMVSANRDESTYVDADVVDFDRNDVPHLAFSYGIHHCLGAQLARMELQVVTRALVQRFPTLRLAVPISDIVWRSGSILRGPLELPVTWQEGGVPSP